MNLRISYTAHNKYPLNEWINIWMEGQMGDACRWMNTWSHAHWGFGSGDWSEQTHGSTGSPWPPADSSNPAGKTSYGHGNSLTLKGPLCWGVDSVHDQTSGRKELTLLWAGGDQGRLPGGGEAGVGHWRMGKVRWMERRREQRPENLMGQREDRRQVKLGDFVEKRREEAIKLGEMTPENHWKCPSGVCYFKKKTTTKKNNETIMLSLVRCKEKWCQETAWISESGRPGLEFQPCWFFTVWLWTGDFTSLNHSFFF